MDLIRIARRVGKKPKSKTPDPEIPESKSDVLDPGVEYSFKIDLTFTVDFEGNGANEKSLRKKLKSEIGAAIKSAALMTAHDLGITPKLVSVSAMSIESAISDQMSVDDMKEW